MEKTASASMPSSTDAAVASALAFIEAHGVVLASARGPAPRMIDVVAGDVIVGNWWSHPKANAIYNVLSTASESPDVLACRLVGGKVTLVHRRLWPSLVRLADRFAPEQICQVHNEHTPSGRHVVRELPFPEWVPADVAQQAEGITEADALASFGQWLPRRATR